METFKNSLESFSSVTLDNISFPMDYEDEEEEGYEIGFDQFIPKTTVEFIIYYLHMANITGVTPLIALLGVFSGFINLVIFKSQGFKDTVNIVLFANSWSDLFASLSGALQKMLNNPLILMNWGHLIPHYASEPFGEILHTTALYMSYRFTALVTVERCLCITLPLKVKDIVTVGSIKGTVIIIAIVTFLSSIPAYLQIADEHVYDTTNKTIPGFEIAFEIRQIVVEVDMFLLFICYGIIIFCSIILVLKLVQKSKWRQKMTATTNSEGEATLSQRDLKVVKMIFIVALVFIGGSTPDIIMKYLKNEEFKSTAYYVIILGISYLGEALNASVNIFIYYNMSSKYKAIFRSMFCGESASLQTKES